jgi:bacillithiol biosynthesis deacetylase BshB1
MKINLLAFAAHPDDVELSCSGTMYKHKQLGYSTGVIDLTRGELGTRGDAESRMKEAKSAAEILQLNLRENLDLGDGFFEINEDSIKKIIVIIRKYQPDVILCNAISDRHPDHGRGGDLVHRATFMSGLMKIETYDEDVAQNPWRPKAVYRYIQDNHITPDFVVDISAYYNIHREAILAYRSQFFDAHAVGPVTPISTKEFLDFNEARCREFGRQIGVTFAEGFNRCRYIGVDNIFDLI